MNKMNRRQLFLYGISGIGPNMLNLMVGAYLCDALMVEGIENAIDKWTYCSKTLVIVALWGILVTIAKIIDGIIDVPFGSISDRLKTKWGKRRPALLFGNIMMVICYLMFLVVPVNAEGNLFNTIWFAFWLASFYCFYTLTMVTYYATFSEVTKNDEDRIFLSNVKSGVDVVYFVLGYALVPVLVEMDFANVRIISLLVMIFMASMVIPFVLLKEKNNLNDTEETTHVKEPNMFEALKYVIKNKTFMVWMIIYGALQFGLSMYLTGFSVYYKGTMAFSGLQMMLCNVCAFAPVPLTLIIYNKLVNKKGFKRGFQYSVLMFTIGMSLMVFCREQWVADPSLRLVFAMIGALITSFGTGSFFSVSYSVPSHIAAIEREKKGLSYPSMYFAVQGLVEAVISAISTGIIWVSLKAMEPTDFILTQPAGGSGLMTMCVAISCIVALIFTSFLPKELNYIGQINKNEE